jgi:HAD superfamily hydrolase (TIGR01509 family)
MRFDLIIFDCDGVLVDSELIGNQVFAQVLTEIGMPISREETMRLFIGRSMAACLEIIEQRLGQPVPENFLPTYFARMFAAFEKELQAVPGVVELLDRIDHIDAPICVASSGEHEKMRKTLGLTGLLPRFEGRMFSATEVAHGKPWPDLFLYAAQKMGFQPARCAVIEDSILGAQAGIAAGMTVFGFARHTDAAALAQTGATVFYDMKDLYDLLN